MFKTVHAPLYQVRCVNEMLVRPNHEFEIKTWFRDFEITTVYGKNGI